MNRPLAFPAFPWLCGILVAFAAGVAQGDEPRPLWVEVDRGIVPRQVSEALAARTVVVCSEQLTPPGATETLALPLTDGRTVLVARERTIRNRSGSLSWVGRVLGADPGSVVFVTRGGVTVGSIRVGSSLHLLLYQGNDERGEAVHAVYGFDEDAAAFAEETPTPVTFAADRIQAAREQVERMARGEAPQDDGSVHDLLVVYTPAALEAVGDVVALENLIDLGVTETNLSYENSGVAHRLELVHTALTPYDENQPGDYRDRLQDPADGHMDEVHPLRDQWGADLVKLITAGGSCGRAFIMEEVSLAFEAFAFCWTKWVCISPGYTFQHELGHLQAGRHQWGGDDTDNAPFTFNHGYLDVVNGFRTIMAANDFNTCKDCPRRLYWANPEVDDPRTGAPMGIPEGEPLAADNRKTLNATAWTVANFRQSIGPIFGDGFESGDTSAWTLLESGSP